MQGPDGSIRLESRIEAIMEGLECQAEGFGLYLVDQVEALKVFKQGLKQCFIRTSWQQCVSRIVGMMLGREKNKGEMAAIPETPCSVEGLYVDDSRGKRNRE